MIALDYGVRDIEIECDSLVLVNAVLSDSSTISEIQSILMDIKQRLNLFRRWRIEHRWREANACADHLANLGCERRDVLKAVRLEVPPANMAALLLRDRLGLGDARSVRPP